MNNGNIFQIQGVIYEKPVRLVKSKKDGKEYEFKSIILEIRREYKDKIYTDLPEFNLGFGVDDSGFEVGDKVQISFSLAGKRVNKDWHKTEIKALYIKHPDIQNDDTKEIGFDPKRAFKKDDVFVAPDPYEVDRDENDNDLPF